MLFRTALAVSLIAIFAAAPALANGRLCERALEQRFGDKEVLMRCLPFAVEGDALAQATMSRFFNDEHGTGIVRQEDKVKKWFDRAAAAFRKRAAAGDAEAAYRLGIMHWQMSLVKPETPEIAKRAGEWLRRAAEKNHPEAQLRFAQYLYGNLPETGDVKPEQISRIRALLERAAHNGQSDALSTLGEILEFGIGGQQDVKAAVRLYLKAAERGSGMAQMRLQRMYEKGDGVAKDPVRAYLWVKVPALMYPGELDEQVEAMAKALTPAQLAEANGQAEAIHRRIVALETKQAPLPPAKGTPAACRAAFEAGDGRRVVHECAQLARNGDDDTDGDAAYRMALTHRGGYLDGGRERQRVTEALKWFRLGADRGDPRAQNAVGMLHLNGEGSIKPDHAEAFWWLWQAAGRGLAQAQYNLGALYLNEKVTPPSLPSAYFWLKLAALQDLSRAKEALRNIQPALDPDMTRHYDAQIAKWKPQSIGDPVKTAPKNAAALCRAAFEKDDMAAADRNCPGAAWLGDAEAQANLGILYIVGWSAAPSWPLAYAWLKLAADNGNPRAKDELTLGKGVFLDLEDVDAAYIAMGDKLAAKMKQEIAKRGRPVK